MATTASRREERRQLQHDLSRNQLLDAAEEVFGARGYHATTLRTIAERAEFSVGSVYSFFANKDDLFLHVFLRRGEEFLPGMEEAATAGDDPVAQLHALVDYEVGFFRRHPHFGRLYLRSFPGDVLESSPELVANFDRAMAVQAGIFRRGRQAGVLRDGDPEVLGRLLTGLVAGYQSTDPAVVGEPPSADERLPLDALHEVVDGAFGAG